MRRPLLTVAVTLFAAALLPSGLALAQAETETIHETFDDVIMDVGCEDVVPIHIVGKSIVHITQTDSSFHITGTFTGRFEFTEDGETFSGRFTQWFGENSNSRSFNGTFTFSATGRSDQGTKARFNAVAHITINANGDLTVEFERLKGGCG
jgi:hypothetical protein